MTYITDADHTVTLLAADGTRHDVFVPAGTHELGTDPDTDAALEWLWGSFLAVSVDRPQIPDGELVELTVEDTPDSAPKKARGAKTATDTEKG